ncbi:MAG: MerR family transcriptional regulator [Muricomes sp.]
MEYSINEVSKIAGISARALRYYDKIGLLKPALVRESGYRYYGEKELELLQQILFYKERGLKLEQIAEILHGNNFDIITALHEHLEKLEQQKIKVDSMITTVKKTIASMKGEIAMSNEERFESFKKDLVQKNEEMYGEEIREKYGAEEVEAVNQEMLNMSEEYYQNLQYVGEIIKKSLEEAVQTGADPKEEFGRNITELHKEWLCMTWKQYTPDAHKAMAQMYESDPRFAQYYDETVQGCAHFLNSAVDYWADKI